MWSFARNVQAQQEVSRRRAQEKTYTEPLAGSAPDLKEFLTEFYRNVIYKVDSQMNEELVKYPDTVGAHYKALVPQKVSHIDFWQRYFYRCDEERVLKELVEAEAEVRRERSAAFKKSLQSVTSQAQQLKAKIEEGLNSSFSKEEEPPALTLTEDKKKKAEQGLSSSQSADKTILPQSSTAPSQKTPSVEKDSGTEVAAKSEANEPTKDSAKNEQELAGSESVEKTSMQSKGPGQATPSAEEKPDTKASEKNDESHHSPEILKSEQAVDAVKLEEATPASTEPMQKKLKADKAAETAVSTETDVAEVTPVKKNVGQTDDMVEMTEDQSAVSEWIKDIAKQLSDESENGAEETETTEDIQPTLSTEQTGTGTGIIKKDDTDEQSMETETGASDHNVGTIETMEEQRAIGWSKGLAARVSDAIGLDTGTKETETSPMAQGAEKKTDEGVADKEVAAEVSPKTSDVNETIDKAETEKQQSSISGWTKGIALRVNNALGGNEDVEKKESPEKTDVDVQKKDIETGASDHNISAIEAKEEQIATGWSKGSTANVNDAIGLDKDTKEMAQNDEKKTDEGVADKEVAAEVSLKTSDIDQTIDKAETEKEQSGISGWTKGIATRVNNAFGGSEDVVKESNQEPQMPEKTDVDVQKKDNVDSSIEKTGNAAQTAGLEEMEEERYTASGWTKGITTQVASAVGGNKLAERQDASQQTESTAKKTDTDARKKEDTTKSTAKLENAEQETGSAETEKEQPKVSGWKKGIADRVNKAIGRKIDKEERETSRGPQRAENETDKDVTKKINTEETSTETESTEPKSGLTETKEEQRAVTGQTRGIVSRVKNAIGGKKDKKKKTESSQKIRVASPKTTDSAKDDKTANPSQETQATTQKTDARVIEKGVKTTDDARKTKHDKTSNRPSVRATRDTILVALLAVVASFSIFVLLAVGAGLVRMMPLTAELGDTLCAPVKPGTKIDSEDVISEAPWWAPDSMKARGFNILCGDRIRTRLEWVEQKQGIHRLVLADADLNSLQMVDRRRLHSAEIFADHIILHQKQKTETVDAPWKMKPQDQ